ncbi:hypothetical protein L6164_021480 [Bauhinia variegata]|uniref:Uncharacterized protein n=1 Tax=Bauhinia variegata TaxID=167791 RepID=A0ACB9MYB1_BAUVA|nr:hypothetical protein L6164_021480 [Bauhinia variegata]
MASNSLSFTLVTLCILVMLLSPSEAVRFPTATVAVKRPICPACVCCTPPPPGSCCDCCASPIQTQSYHSQSP